MVGSKIVKQPLLATTKLQLTLRGWLFLILGLLPLWSQAAELDPLLTPAKNSRLASTSLLLDIDRAGEQRLVVVGERGHILFSDDAGHSWQQAARVPVSVTLTAVDFVDAEQGWAVGHDGTVLHSDDGGLNWQLQLDGNAINRLVLDYYQQLLERADAGEPLGYDLETLEIALEDAQFASEDGPTKPLLDLYFADRQQGWVIGAYGLLLHTADGGQSWQPAMLALDNPDGFHLNAITAQQGELVISGEAGGLFRSSDQHSAWQRLDAGYEGPYFSVAHIAQQQRLVLTGLRGRLFISDDKGQNWQALEASTGATFNATIGLQDGGLLAAGNGGVLLYLESQAHSADQALIHTTSGRQSYTAVIETSPGQLVLVGQGGVSRLEVEQITGAVQ